MRRLGFEALAVRAFRNLEDVDLAPSLRFNVVSGDNGQGKTNLLEAIYVVATSKSFRAPKPGDVVRHGAEVASVRARVREEDESREQSVGLKIGARLARVDGKKPPSLAAYALRTPVVVFHPGEISLSMGEARSDAGFLDRLSLYVRVGSLDEMDRYQRAMRERQRALETRGTSAADLDQWEELMVRHGLAVMDVRADVSERLAAATKTAFEEIAAPGLELDGHATPPGRRATRTAYRRAPHGGALVGPSAWWRRARPAPRRPRARSRRAPYARRRLARPASRRGPRVEGGGDPRRR